MVFLLSITPFLSLLLPYKKGEKLAKEVLIDCNGFQLCHTKNNRHDVLFCTCASLHHQLQNSMITSLNK